MTEQRITTIEEQRAADPATGQAPPPHTTHSHTTVIADEPRSGGMGKWVMIAILLVLGFLAVLAFTQMSDAEAAKDNAIAGAAESVGGAAEQVGEAAGQMGEAAQDAAQNLGE